MGVSFQYKTTTWNLCDSGWPFQFTSTDVINPYLYIYLYLCKLSRRSAEVAPTDELVKSIHPKKILKSDLGDVIPKGLNPHLERSRFRNSCNLPRCYHLPICPLLRKVQQFDLRDVSQTRLPEADLVMASDVLYESFLAAPPKKSNGETWLHPTSYSKNKVI